jgi:hypothetical protein
MSFKLLRQNIFHFKLEKDASKMLLSKGILSHSRIMEKSPKATEPKPINYHTPGKLFHVSLPSLLSVSEKKEF